MCVGGRDGDKDYVQQRVKELLREVEKLDGEFQELRVLREAVIELRFFRRFLLVEVCDFD